MHQASEVGIRPRVMRVLTRSVRSTLAILMALAVVAPALAQEEKDVAREDEHDLLLSHWRWMQELKLPEKSEGPYLALPIAPAVFGREPGGPHDKRGDFRDKMPDDFHDKVPFELREQLPSDLRDVRIADAKGNRVPYALRIMRKQSRQTNLSARQFDAGPSTKSRSYQVSLELTQADVKAPGHNEIEIHTSGSNFRRRVEVVGADTDKFDDPQMILDKKSYVVHYAVDGKTVELYRFRYAFKQFRHLRVRVFADATGEEDIPKITNVIVRRSIEDDGEYVTEQVNLMFQGGVRADFGAGTAWLIEFPNRMPCEKLTFEVNSPPSERPFRLQIANPGRPAYDTGAVEWRWRKDGEKQLLDISFPEVIAQRLRLVVTDFANEPLRLQNVQATRCVRKLIIEKLDPEKFTPPLRLYVGNANVVPANYVLGQKLPELLKPAPALIEAGELRENPAYVPPPLTLHQRAPWLVYVVLGIACAVLLVILAGLARQAIGRHDALAPTEAKATAP